tara:strand:- start:890 stop:1057 length:168 start_codon:yes stop_codon:yes gene_type:complete
MFKMIWNGLVALHNGIIASRQAAADAEIMRFIRTEYPNENPAHVLHRIQNGVPSK